MLISPVKMQYFFVLLASCAVVIAALPSIIPNSSFSPRNNSIMFLGELDIAGYTNQLFGIFSLVPVALLLNATVLIVGPVFSRFSFSHTWEDFASGKKHNELPFSYFYDWEYFHEYWYNNTNLTVVEKHTVDHYLNYTSFTRIVRPKFFSHKDEDILNYVKTANVTIPIPENSKLRIIGNHKLIAFYEYWQSDKHLKLLHQMDESLKPNATLASLINGIVQLLGNNYIVVHLRVEADKFQYHPEHTNNVDKEFLDNIYNMTRLIVNHKCFKPYNTTNRSNKTSLSNNTPESSSSSPSTSTTVTTLPVVYIASGVFHVKYRKKPKHFMAIRANTSLNLFYANGITNIFTQLNLTGNLLHLLTSLSPEQLAYVEQVVARRSACFVHSPYKTSWSYMVLRLKQMDQRRRLNSTLRMWDYGTLPSSYVGNHLGWGFRRR